MNVTTMLQLLAREPAAPLDGAEVALQLARDEYPDLDIEAYLSEIQSMSHEARRYLRGSFAARVTGLCRYLFHDQGFRGNAHNYYDPRNSYLNQVLDRRTGIPITLSLIVMAVARHAEMTVEGVGLPGHFIVKAVEKGETIYLDPYHGGRQLTLEDCGNLIQQAIGQELPLNDDLLAGISLQRLIQRLLTNLKTIYHRTQDLPREIRVLERLRLLAPTDVEIRRDLGQCWLQAGQPGRAIDHLTAWLTVAPDDPATPLVRRQLDQARRDLARWN